MLDVFLTIFMSVCIAVILKMTELRHYNRVVIIGTNYFTAAGLLAALLFFRGNFHFSGLTFGLGLIGGVTFPLGFYFITRAIGKMGLSISVSVMRLSVVIPTFGSLLVWHEHPNEYQIAGIGLTLLALALLSNFSLEKKQSGTQWILILALFLTLGFNDFLMKIFESLRPIDEKDSFLFVLFGFSGILSWLFIAVTKIRLRLTEIFWGLGLGFPNMLTTFFFILALNQLPGVEVFPTVNIGIITFSLLLGIWIWGEKLSPREWAGFVVALAAVTLLNVKG